MPRGIAGHQKNGPIAARSHTKMLFGHSGGAREHQRTSLFEVPS